jgi:hypothetical protein
MHLKPIPGEKEMEPNTPLWRYMSFGAFFLLLQRNKVFVPLLTKLQEADPKEMRMSQRSLNSMPGGFVHSEPFQQAREWLKEKHSARTGFDLERWTAAPNCHNPMLIEEWIWQLGVRRCAWCWFSPAKPPANWMESMAMWSLYARNGVAIKTTLAQIRAAFREQGLNDVLGAEVQYCIQGAPNTLFANQEYAKRPFLLKSASYRHENEVRLVFQVKAAAVESGLKVDVDAKTLLEGGEVIISPFVLPDEARALIDVAEGLLPGVTVEFRASSEHAPGPNDPTHGLGWRDDLERHYKPFGQEPGLPDLLLEL